MVPKHTLSIYSLTEVDYNEKKCQIKVFLSSETLREYIVSKFPEKSKEISSLFRLGEYYTIFGNGLNKGKKFYILSDSATLIYEKHFVREIRSNL